MSQEQQDDSEEDKQEIFKFDPELQLPEYGVIVFTGRSGSGKTVCILDILSFYKDRIDQPIVMCGSKDTCKDYAKHIPASFVWNGFFPDRLKTMYEKQERNVEMGKDNVLLIILDDLAYLKRSLNKDQTINRILYNGRHAHIIMFIAMQYCKDITPDLRQQVKLIFACSEKNPQNRERLYTAFNPVFRNFNDFDKCMQACTNNHEVFVLNNQHTSSSAISDNVNYYKAKLNRKYLVNECGPIWGYHRRKYDKHHYLRTDKEREEFKQQQEKKKRNKSTTKKGGSLIDTAIVKRGKKSTKPKSSGSSICKTSNGGGKRSDVYPYAKLK